MIVNRRLYRNKEIVTLEVRDKDIYNLDNPLFSVGSKNFNNKFMSNFDESTLNRFSKKTSRTGKENDFKRKVLSLTQETIMESLIIDDDVINLLRGEYLIHIGKRDRGKFDNLTQASYYQQEVFPLVEIIREDERLNVFFKIILRGPYLAMIKKYKNLRSYARKCFVH